MKDKKEIQYIYGSKELLEFVEPLWEKLNIHHQEKSIHFKEKFRNFNFKIRREVMDKKQSKKVHVILAKDIEIDEYIGYCISSVSKENIGEIESIFIEAQYRGFEIGDKLIRKSIEWIKDNGANKITVGVVAGNEEVFGFYSKYDFYPKVTILDQILE